MLGQQPSVGGDQTAAAGIGAQEINRTRDGMHHVIVQRAPGKGQAAGNGQRTILGNADFIGGHLHGGREATVKIDIIYI